jgi:hypothetical protein
MVNIDRIWQGINPLDYRRRRTTSFKSTALPDIDECHRIHMPIFLLYKRSIQVMPVNLYSLVSFTRNLSKIWAQHGGSDQAEGGKYRLYYSNVRYGVVELSGCLSGFKNAWSNSARKLAHYKA